MKNPDVEKQKKLNTPYDDASCLSKLFFHWVTQIFIKSIKRELKESEIFDLSITDTSEYMTSLIEKHWKNELNKKNPKLYRACIAVFWKSYMLYGILLLIENVVQLGQGVVIWKILLLSRHVETDMDELILYSSLLVLSVFITILMRNPYFYYTLRAGLQLKVGISGLIYKKILRLNQQAMGKTTTGQIINLLTNDVQKCELNLPHLHYIWIGPLASAAALVLLYFFSREGGIAALFLFVIILPIQLFLGRFYSNLRKLIAQITDERIKLISELLNGIKVVKMYCWEPMFVELIRQVRRKELIYGFKYRMALTNQFAQMLFQTKLGILILMVVAYVYGLRLGASLIFSSVATLNYLRSLMSRYIPYFIQHLLELKVTFHRVETFLQLPEFSYENTKSNYKHISSQTNDKSKIVFENVVCKWSPLVKVPDTLHNISFKLEGPQICAVVGEIGAGKTSLLMALLGELPLSSGKVVVQGSISYAAQQPWVFGGTVLQNILFNNKYHYGRLQSALQYSTLNQDLRMMQYGVKTQVGERGVTMSGGQKARVSIARVLYENTDIVLLDDPLAAVDANVASKLFFECIQEGLKDKLVILVTHQTQFLKHVDNVMFLKDGEILSFGTYKRIIETNSQVSTMIDELASVNEDKTIEQHLETFVPTLTEASSTNQGTSRFPKFSAIRSISSRLLSFSRIDMNQNAATNNEIKKENSKEDYLKDQLLLKKDNKKHDDDDDENNATPNNEDELEDVNQGYVNFKIYWYYLINGSHPIVVIIYFISLLCTLAIYIFCDVWLTWWTADMDKRPLNMTNFYKNDEIYFYVLIGLTLGCVFFSFFSIIFLFGICTLSSTKLHQHMLQAVIRSPMSFFDATPVGRILNRFSKDMGIIDDLLPVTLVDAILILSMVFASLGIAAYKNYYSIIAIVVLLGFFMLIRKPFINVTRTIKRFEAITRSPAYSHVSATLQGLVTIRAHNRETWFISEFYKKQDRNSKSFFLYVAASRWFAMRLDELCLIFIAVVVYSCVLLVHYSLISTSSFGLILVYIIGLIGMAQWGVRQSVEVENQMIAPERAFEYINLPSESAVEMPIDKELQNWPNKGSIEFINVSLRYSDTAFAVLNGINLSIQGGEKIGIVGRTGAGKSSLVAVLFRLIELNRNEGDNNGRLLIDDVDIAQVGLKKLRISIAAIPQDPVMFVGTIRRNLDPYMEFTEEQLWEGLSRVELDVMIRQLPNGLESEITEGGANFSVGQRQLICLTRAVLKKAKIVVVDEATANVDDKTDELIQRTIKTHFKDSTVLTIAHRLQTIMDSDRIIVMSEGKIVELGHPYELLQLEDGIFLQLVQQTGGEEEKKLRQIAQASYTLKKYNAGSRTKLF